MPKASSTETNVARPRALELFTDRGEQQDILRAVIAPAGQHSDRSQFITVFYGVGGVGKSALRRRAQEIAATEFPKVKVATLDVDSSHWTPAVPAVHLFVDLVALLERSSVSMRLTQALLVIYAQSESRVSVRLDDGGLWDKAFSVVDKGAEFTGIPYAGAIIKGARWLREKQAQLSIRQQLKKLHLWPTEQDDKVNLLDLEEKIGKAIFEDVIAWLDHDETRQLRLIVDGFERLQGTERRIDAQKRLQEVLGYFAASDTPQVKRFRVVVFGRNRLRWDELYGDDEWKNFWNQHLLSGLGLEDARLFLESYANWLKNAGRAETALALETHLETILDAADERIEGTRQIYPFYLDLAVEHLQNCVHKRRSPDFGKTPMELQERFLKYLGEAEERALMILALAEIFDEPLYDCLAKERLIALPAGAFHSGLRRDHSYFEKVQKAGPDSWKLHRKMEDVLQDRWLSSDTLSTEGAAITKRVVDFYGKAISSKPVPEWGAQEVEFWRRGMEILVSQGPERGLLSNADWQQLYSAPWGSEFPRPATEVRAYYDRGLAALESRLGSEHIDVLWACGFLGGACENQGDYPAAEKLLRRAVAGLDLANGVDPTRADAVRSTLANVLRQRDHKEEARALFREILQRAEATHGTDSLEAARASVNLAIVAENPKEAVGLQRRALEVNEMFLGYDHPDSLVALNNLAITLAELGDDNEADKLFRRVLASREKLLGPDHPQTLQTLFGLAGAAEKAHDYSRAEAFYRRVIDGWEESLGSSHPRTIDAIRCLANLLEQTQQYEAAIPLLQRSADACEKELGPHHPGTIDAIRCRENLLEQTQQYEAEIPLLQRAGDAQEKELGPSHPLVLGTWLTLMEALGRTRQYERAANVGFRSVAHASAPNADSYFQRFLVLIRKYVHMLRLHRDFAVAAHISRQALALLRSMGRYSEPCIGSLRYDLACCECANGNLEESRLLIREEISKSSQPEADLINANDGQGAEVRKVTTEHRDPRAKDVANVFWQPEYTHYCLETDLPIFPNEHEQYSIWYASNEFPYPQHHCCAPADLQTHYKFIDYSACSRWCRRRLKHVALGELDLAPIHDYISTLSS